MKRLGLIIAAVGMSLSVSFAQGINKGNEPFKVDFKKLSTYLELTPNQMGDVSEINDYFIQAQAASKSSSAVRQEKKLLNAVYGNLKMMKSVLDDAQYRKYIALINVTNNNNGTIRINALPDEVYYANNN